MCTVQLALPANYRIAQYYTFQTSINDDDGFTTGAADGLVVKAHTYDIGCNST